MKNLKKIMFVLFTVFAVCCFTGCLSFLDNQDGWIKSQTDGTVLESKGNSNIQIIFSKHINGWLKDPKWCYNADQTVYRIEFYTPDSDFTTQMFFDNYRRAKSGYDTLDRFVSASLGDKYIYKNMTLCFGGEDCYEIIQSNNNGKTLTAFTYCFKTILTENDPVIPPPFSKAKKYYYEGKNEYIGDYFNIAINPYRDTSKWHDIDSINTRNNIFSSIVLLQFYYTEQNRFLGVPQSAYGDTQPVYVIVFRLFLGNPDMLTFFYFDDKDRAKSAWNHLTREFRAVHGLGGDAAQDNFFAEWTKNYGGSYCTKIRYENGQIFEYCFKGKGAKHNPFDGGLVTSKDAYVRPYLP